MNVVNDEKMRLEYLDPELLRDNPPNWRTHPDRQTRLLDEVIGEVDWAGAALLNERTVENGWDPDDAVPTLIDGHLRKKVAIKRGDKIPVLIGSWSPQGEKKILRTLDPIAALAETDKALLDELSQGIETESDINEDVNTYTRFGSTGSLFLTIPALKLQQKSTQQNKGGMTETYLESGTYLKSFYSVMYHPSGVTIARMGPSKRIHHKVSWRYTVPCLINERHQKVADNG